MVSGFSVIVWRWIGSGFEASSSPGIEVGRVLAERGLDPIVTLCLSVGIFCSVTTAAYFCGGYLAKNLISCGCRGGILAEAV